jgi:RHS repeat-associated protein
VKKRNLIFIGLIVICLLAIPVGYLVVKGWVVNQPPPITNGNGTTEHIEPAPVSLAHATEFLYTGDHPRQVGVKEGSIDLRRVAVLRGLVQTREGESLARVTVSVEGHPEFGSTESQADGMFDLVVNGGGQLCVHYHKHGFLPVCRQLAVPWQDYTRLPDVALIPADDKVSAIDLTADTPIQVAQGSQVKDADGTRQATLFIPRGTQATMFPREGGEKKLSALKIRLTEYTVGSRGPSAMPAPLPPSSAYTYAIELGTDETMAGGKKIRGKDLLLSKPVPLFVDNFLGFPVGTPVPVGYYDNDKAAWIPEPNGLVIKILALQGDLAVLDVEGKRAPADARALERLGVTDDERRQLAKQYKPGQSLWRVLLTHFSTRDLNLPFRGPRDAVYPGQGPCRGDGQPNGSNQACGSIIECQNQALAEALPLTGSPWHLHYHSRRVVGRKAAFSLEVPLSGDQIPKSLKRIDLEVHLAGQRWTQSFPARPQQRTTVTWDGLDGYGRPVPGQRPATVRVGYVYNGVYEQGPLFGAPGNGVDVTGSVTRQEITLWQEHKKTLGALDARAQGLGGWTLTIQHAYDPIGQLLYLGDGRERHIGAIGRLVTTVAGGRSPVEGVDGDGGPAVRAYISPQGVTVGADGSLYIADAQQHRIRRVGRDGVITTVAGTNTGVFPSSRGGYSGDDGPARKARLNSPRGVALAPDGSLYIADTMNHCIRRVGTDGVVTTVAGTGKGQYGGDGGPAVNAHLNEPYAVALAPDGSLYVADTGNHRIRRVGTDGVITTVAGGKSGTNRLFGGGYAGDGGPASHAVLNQPHSLALAPDGSLYIADTLNHRIRRIGSDGIITTVAGSSAIRTGYGDGGYAGDFGPAAEAKLNEPSAIAITSDGTLYILDSLNSAIRRVTPDGIITTQAGTGRSGTGGDGGPAAKAQFSFRTGLSDWDANRSCGLAVGPNGSLYISDWGSGRVRRITGAWQGFAENDILIPSDDGAALHVFDSTGRHLRTVETLTALVLHRFEYDSAGRLTAVVDRDGKQTRVERDSQGLASAIVTPFGQRTALNLNSHGYLASVSRPNTEPARCEYSDDGLLLSLKDPKGNSYRFRYDDMGRLTRDEDPAGGFTALARTETAKGFEVALTTALKPATTYRVEPLPSGGESRVNTCCCGAQTRTEIDADGGYKVIRPDGAVVSLARQQDPRWGMQAPLLKTLSVTTPGGRTLNVSADRQVKLKNQTDLMTLFSQTDTISVNGRNYYRTYEAAKKQTTLVTPANRRVVTTVDGKGQVGKVEIPDLLPIRFERDEKGRLTAIAQGEGKEARSFRIGYDEHGRIATLTDPLKRTMRLEYNEANRVVKQVLADGREIAYKHDANGNPTTITPPGRPAHSFDYTLVNQVKEYQPPPITEGGKGTGYQYNRDRKVTQVTLPDGARIDVDYDRVGHPAAVTFPSGKVRISFDEKTEQLKSITTAEGEVLSYGYDGFLLTGTTWKGPIQGRVGRTHDNDFRLASLSVNDGPPVEFKYDPDGLLARAGALTLEHHAGNGLLTGTKLGEVATKVEYNGYGEVEHFRAAPAGKEIFVVHYERDALGRIKKKTETISGETVANVYDYDQAGRLENVTRNGVRVAHYEYDRNGNRLVCKRPDGETKGEYDVQDRLLRYGDATYRHKPTGEWRSKTVNGKTTTYDYDALGNLRTVLLPDGTKIEYVIDGQNRRVGKKVNGKLVQGFLYASQLRPVAELDGQNNVVARFVYAGGVNVPEYMEKGGKTYRFIKDHLGSPRLVIEATTGEVVQHIDFDEFGNVLQDTNSGFQPFGFAGGLYDRDTRLVRFGVRDYDLLTGRWTAKDPIRFEAADANLYAYVHNDPISFIDPSGLVDWGRFAGGVIQVAAGAATFAGTIAAIGAIGISGGILIVPVFIIGITVGSWDVGAGIGNTVSAFFPDPGPPFPAGIGEAIGVSVGGERGEQIGAVIDIIVGAATGGFTAFAKSLLSHSIHEIDVFLHFLGLGRDIGSLCSRHND